MKKPPGREVFTHLVLATRLAEVLGYGNSQNGKCPLGTNDHIVAAVRRDFLLQCFDERGT